MKDDQLVTIHAPGAPLVAIGSPELICALLAAGRQVVCNAGEFECTVRIVAGVVISYPEATEED